MNRYDDSCYDWAEILGDSRFIAMVCQEEAWNLLKNKVPEEKFIPK